MDATRWRLDNSTWFPSSARNAGYLDDANFGIAEQTYTLDYYDGELQLIDHSGIRQSVTLA